MKYFGIYGIIQYLNKIQKQTTDSYVAKVLYENRNSIENARIDVLAREHGLSQASVSRFIQKIGFNSFREYQNVFTKSLVMLDNNHQRVASNVELKSNEEIKNQVYNNIYSCLNQINDLNLDELNGVIQYIQSFKNIIFLGSEMSMNIAYLWQLELVQQDKNIYCFNDPLIQYEETVKQEECVFVVINCTGDWLKGSQDLLDVLKNKKNTVLFTTAPYNRSIDFKYTYVYGKKNEFAHNNLMYLIPLCRDLSIKNYSIQNMNE